MKVIYRGLLCWLLMLPCFFCSRPVEQGEPYAPWAKFAEEPPPAIFKARALRKSEVKVPPYPNGYLTSIGVLKVDRDNNETLVVNLLTADDEDQVIAFYKDRLLNNGEWNYNNTLGVFFQAKTMLEAVMGKKYIVKITGASVESPDTIYIDKAFLKQMKARIRVELTLPGE